MEQLSTRQRGPLVITAIEKKYQVHLAALAQEVYSAYKASKGSEEGLQLLIKQHAPRPTAPSTTPQTTPSTAIITPEGQKSSTNQALQPNIAPGGVVNGVVGGVVSGVGGAVGGAPEGVVGGVVDVFAAAQKLSDERAISMAKRRPIHLKRGHRNLQRGLLQALRNVRARKRNYPSLRRPLRLLQKLAESVYKGDSDPNSDPKAIRNVLTTVPRARKEPATAPSTPPRAPQNLAGACREARKDHKHHNKDQS